MHHPYKLPLSITDNISPSPEQQQHLHKISTWSWRPPRRCNIITGAAAAAAGASREKEFRSDHQRTSHCDEAISFQLGLVSGQFPEPSSLSPLAGRREPLDDTLSLDAPIDTNWKWSFTEMWLSYLLAAAGALIKSHICAINSHTVAFRAKKNPELFRCSPLAHQPGATTMDMRIFLILCAVVLVERSQSHFCTTITQLSPTVSTYSKEPNRETDHYRNHYRHHHGKRHYKLTFNCNIECNNSMVSSCGLLRVIIAYKIDLTIYLHTKDSVFRFDGPVRDIFVREL